MQINDAEVFFNEEIINKYVIYNSLFSHLPYNNMSNLGTLNSLLSELGKKELQNKKNPKNIIEDFLNIYASNIPSKERIDLLFNLIQFIERKVVLFDSVEDSSFEKIAALEHHKGTLENIYQIARQQKKLIDVSKKLKDLKVRVVFTAHPTQFYPNTVLKIIADLEIAIQKNDISEINVLLQQLGKTPFINKKQPTPIDESDSIMYYLRYIYYKAIGDLHEEIQKKFYNNDENSDFSSVMELGFWPGGDRDGNPFVTSDITKKVTDNLRTSILKCYYFDLKKILRRITFRGAYEKLTELSDIIYENIFTSKHSITTKGILDKLYEIREIITEKHDGIFIEQIDRFIRQIKTFELHFASLDIRQDSSIHNQVINAIIGKYSLSKKRYEEMNDSEKEKILFNSNILINENDFDDEIVKDTIKNISNIKHIQKKNGDLSIHRYIISNSTTAFNVLEIFALFKMVGYKDSEIKIDIIPLFETVEGLESAENVMKTLYNHSIYKKHLKFRHNKQTIMLGFSDGTKDGGYVKANWGIFKAKENLTRVSKEHDIDVVFFDGRGGPPARGGGKTRQFYASQGPTIASDQIQLTIQGQTITSSYGSVVQAKHNFEQLITAGISNALFYNNSTHLTKEDRELLNELSEISYKKYEDLKKHPMFLPYLEERTVVKYYGKTNIGSRPSKRGASSSLEFKDLRAIPFVGAWSQAKQNVPGYFGFGSALKKIRDEGRFEELINLFKKSLYFRTLIENSIMSMMKCNFQLTAFMHENDKYSKFWNILNDEFELSKKLMLEISEQKVLMERETNRLSVTSREEIMLPLLIIQQYAIQKINSSDDSEEKLVFEKMLIRTLFGIINASRNSA